MRRRHIFFISQQGRSPVTVTRRCVIFSPTLERGYPILQEWFPVRMNVEDYDDFLAQHDRFMVYGPYGYRFDRVIHKLKDDGAQLTLLDQDEKDFHLFLVTTEE